MKYKIEPIENGVKISDITNDDFFEFILSESIDLSWIINRLADTVEPVELDTSKMVDFSKMETGRDNYQEILSLGRILYSIFGSHKGVLEDIMITE